MNLYGFLLVSWHGIRDADRWSWVGVEWGGLGWIGNMVVYDTSRGSEKGGDGRGLFFFLSFFFFLKNRPRLDNSINHGGP